jgi:hypothetical protein
MFMTATTFRTSQHLPSIPATPAVDEFDSKDYVAQNLSHPYAQVINGKAQEVGIFIKVAEAEKVGFTPDVGWNPHTMQFNDGTQSEGWKTASPRMLVLHRGPLGIFLRDGGQFLGLFEEFKNQYDSKKHLTKVRYAVLFVDAKNIPLHSKPLILTLKGSFSTGFGKAYGAFCEALSDSYITAKNPRNKDRRGQNFACFGAFQFEVFSQLRGKEQKSWVADIKDWVCPTPDTWMTLFVGYDPALKALVAELYEQTEDWTSFDYEAQQQSPMPPREEAESVGGYDIDPDQDF